MGSSWNSCCDPSAGERALGIGQWRLPIGPEAAQRWSLWRLRWQGDLLQGVQPLAATGPLIDEPGAPAGWTAWSWRRSVDPDQQPSPGWRPRRPAVRLPHALA